MRMILPPLKDRRVIHRQLAAFFDQHTVPEFNRAVGAICRFYRIKRPKVEWFEYLDWGRTVGRTYENGRIHLVHPENWKRGRRYNSARQWINAVYHEMGHYIFWTDAERKADVFAARMERKVSNGVGPAPLLRELVSMGNGRPKGKREQPRRVGR